MTKKPKKGSFIKEAKDAEVARLKRKIQRLESDKRKLIAENKTYEAVLELNFKYLEGAVEQLSLEELIEAAKSKKNLKTIKEEHEQNNSCKKCGSPETVVSTGNFGKLIMCKNCGNKDNIK